MKPLDPRLLRYARAARAYLVATVVLGGLTAVLVIAQAWLIARMIDGAFLGGEGLRTLRTPLLVLLLVVVGRASVAWVTESAAQATSARVKSQLRERLLAHAVDLGPAALTDQGTADLTTLATRGVDALDGYFSRYLPQLVLACIVPLTVLVVVLTQDVVAAVIVGLTLPLIPMFMILIGLATRSRTERQFRTLQRLSGHFLDLVAGLPTLKVFGRAKAQAKAVREVTDTYRRTTMATLRLAFVSSLALELIATLSVALVAVSVGLRLVGSELDLRTAMFVLVLAPEAYLPLRLVGANFHASAEGLAAAEQVFTVLAQPLPQRGSATDVPDPAVSGFVVEGLTVEYAGRGEAVLHDVSFAVHPGEVVALTGPSGCGKSTVLNVLLGFVQPSAGAVLVDGRPLTEFDPDAWRSRLAWLPQRPHLFAATLAANIRLGRPDATDEEVTDAVAAAGLSELVARLPMGVGTALGEGGAGLSAGERQRVALARAFLRDAPLLLLDEPTAGLDGTTEAEVLEAVRRLAFGRTVLLVAHRPALIALADRVVELPSRLPGDLVLVAPTEVAR